MEKKALVQAFKGKKNLSKLQKKFIIDKLGRKNTTYVNFQKPKKIKVSVAHWDEPSLQDLPAEVTLKPTTRVFHKQGHYYLNFGRKDGRKRLVEINGGDIAALKEHRKNWKRASVAKMKEMTENPKEKVKTLGEKIKETHRTLVSKPEYEKRKKELDLVLKRLQYISKYGSPMLKRKANGSLSAMKHTFKLKDFNGGHQELLTTLLRSPKKVDRFIHLNKTK